MIRRALMTAAFLAVLAPATAAFADVQAQKIDCNEFRLETAVGGGSARLVGTVSNTCHPRVDQDAVLRMFIDGREVGSSRLDDGDRASVGVKVKAGRRESHEICLALDGRQVDRASEAPTADRLEVQACFKAQY